MDNMGATGGMERGWRRPPTGYIVGGAMGRTPGIP